MKNNLLREILIMSKPLFYVIFLQALFVSFLHAEESKAQRKSLYEIEISLEAKDASILEVFKQIEDKTDFIFTYNDRFIESREVSIKWKNQNMGVILEELSKATDLTFKRINENIHVNRNAGNKLNVTESYAEVTATVTGRVTDGESGEPLPGATVLVKGTSVGTVTDMEGNYSINVPEDASTLVFSFIGYGTREVEISGRSVIDVTMELDISSLNEVVVTGYTSQRKADITGAVTVIDAESLNDVKAPSFAQKLAGRAAGVTVSNSGSPGAGTNIRIRGISSFGSSDPLIIIDGVQVQGDKAMTGLNPNDIESMQVLKDAAASSIYGARASAGVVVITTKSGQKGEVKVSYDGYYGTQSPVGGYNDFLVKDPEEYARWHVQANPSTAAFYGSPITIPTYFYPVNDDGTPMTSVDESTYNYPADPRVQPTLIMRAAQDGTDWWDEVFSPAPVTEHNVGISGGSENGTYSASVGYFNQEGTMDHTYFERISVRVNTRMNLGKFSFGESASLARSEGVFQQGGNQNEQNVMTQILKMNPIVPVHDIGGNFASAKTIGFSNGSNPVALLERNKDDVNEFYRVLANVFGEYEIIDGLKAKTSLSIDFSQNYTPSFNFPTWENREFNANNSFSENHSTGFVWTWTNTLNYSKTFDQHSISVLGGYEAVSSQTRNISGQLNGYGFTSTDVRYLNLSLASFNTLNSNVSNVYRLNSVFGKIDYTFADKYLASFTIRRDGSSNFIDDNRYGNFPAFSLGWRLSEESFMEGATWLSDLKLRGGYGITGNQNIPQAFNAYYLWGARSTYDANYNITGDNTGNTSGYAQISYGNPATGWETNKMTNVGFDASLIDGRVNVVLDVYQKDVTDLLFNPPLPGSAGNAAQPYSNVAEMRNTGWDLYVDYRDRISGDFSFNVGLNLSHYKNEILTLDGNAEIIFPGGVDKRFGEVNAWKIGHPISGFFGYELDGIFQNAAEVAALDQPAAAVGRFRFKDLNNDGQINDADKDVIGSPHPDLTAGLNIGAKYKQFDFTMFLYGSFGADIYNYNKLFTHFGFFNSNISKEVLEDSWSPENTGGSLPAIDGDDSFSLESSTFYVENGSYLRAQNVSIGYNFNPTGVFRNLRVYVQGQNLFTITGYSGIDPALSNVNVGNGQQNDGWTNFDFGNYPSSRTFMIGVNASF